MPRVFFTPNLRRHLDASSLEVAGGTVGDVLAAVFERQPELRGYLLDDQGRLRRHVAIFVDGRRIKDTTTFSDLVAPAGEIYVVQALSGG
jgi:sulfur-carrier protein